MSNPIVRAFLDSTPTPKTTTPPVYIDKEIVKSKINNNDNDYIIVDLRKNDFIGGSIKGALNIPAQSIHPTISTLYDLAKSSGKPNLYIHCVSSRDRAVRVSGWLQDLVEQNNNNNNNQVKPQIIKGGIKEWVNGGKEYIDLMDNYDESCF